MLSHFRHVSRAAGLGVVSVLALQGCTTSLNAMPDSGRSDTALIGVPYSLPMAQYDVTITRQLKRCEVNGLPSVAFDLKASATPGYIAGETFIIDYRTLSKASKTASLTLETYDDTGTLKSINASATDKSGEIAVAGLQTIFSIASIASEIPPLTLDPAFQGDGKKKPVDTLVCSEAARASVENMERQKAALIAEGKALSEATAELSTRIVELAPLISATALSPAHKADLARLSEKQKIATIKYTQAKAQLAAATKPITISRTVKWPRQANERNGTVDGLFELSDIESKKWQRLVALKLVAGVKPDTHICKNYTINEAVNPKKIDLVRCLHEELSVSASISPILQPAGVPSLPAGQHLANENSSKPTTGLLYRSAAMGELRICKGPYRLQCHSVLDQDLVLKSPAPISMPQLGQLRMLPFTNKAFQDNLLKVELRKDGRLKRFEYQDKAATAEVALGVASSATQQLSGYLIARDAAQDARELAEKEADKTALEEAAAATTTARAEQIAQNQHEITLLQNQRDLAALLNPDDTSALDDLNSRAALEEARLRELQAILAQLQVQEALASDTTP